MRIPRRMKLMRFLMGVTRVGSWERRGVDVHGEDKINDARRGEVRASTAGPFLYFGGTHAYLLLGAYNIESCVFDAHGCRAGSDLGHDGGEETVNNEEAYGAYALSPTRLPPKSSHPPTPPIILNFPKTLLFLHDMMMGVFGSTSSIGRPAAGSRN